MAEPPPTHDSTNAIEALLRALDEARTAQEIIASGTPSVQIQRWTQRVIEDLSDLIGVLGLPLLGPPQPEEPTATPKKSLELPSKKGDTSKALLSSIRNARLR